MDLTSGSPPAAEPGPAPARVETKWWTFAAMLAVGLLHLLLPEQLAALGTPEVVAAVVVLLAVVLLIGHDRTFERRSAALRAVSLLLIGVIVIANLISLVLLVRSIVVHGDLSATNLLLGGAVVWVTDVAAFGFIFWEWDRGGPVARNHEKDSPGQADLLFPQMTDDSLKVGFVPFFADYLYVSFTNSIAFSPTDTLPLTRRCKGLFAVESAIAFGTVALVAARAVNILPS